MWNTFTAAMANPESEEFSERACHVFREGSLVPAVVGARIHPAGSAHFEVEANWSQRELGRGKKVVFSKSYFVGVEGGRVKRLSASTFQADASRICNVSYASDCTLKAVLVKDKPAKSPKEDVPAEPQQYIEVWDGDCLLKTIDVKRLKKHGKINEDIHFGSFQLSASGEWLLYVAEREKPKAASFFKKVDQSGEGSAPQRGTEYVFESDWGEQLQGVVCPVVVVINVKTEECSVVDTSKMGDVSAGQAQWVPGEDGGVVFVGWENTPRKLGFVYCLSRRGALYHANFKSGECSRLTDTTHHVFSPRFNNQGDKLVYFEAVANGPHHSCAALKMIDWPTKTVSTVVDIVNKPPRGGFPGFYAVLLPHRCWDMQDKRILLHDWWGSTQNVICVEVEGGTVHRVTGGEGEKGTWTVFDVSHNLIVAQFATPNTPPKLLIGALPSPSSSTMTWTELATTHTPLTEGVSWEVMEFTPEGKDGIPYEAILVMPKPVPSSPLPPLIVAPHGGPHVVLVADFMTWSVCMAALGFAILMVNYRGSGGFGQDSIFSLPGKVGTQEVRDVQNAAQAVVERGRVDGERVVVMGGSHGGFISVHLIGQFPDFYKAASVRNPVTNIAAMHAISDIPDWTYVEAGLPYVPSEPPTVEDLSRMLTASPIVHAKKIKAPLLIHLGSDDQRVPNSQGKQLYHILKAMGKEVKVLLYPGDCHPISSVYSDADSFVNTVTWLYEHSC